ncbi:MAG: hypothetical protein ACKOCH_13740, partial [Bacteroidota bacterium]
IVVMATEKTLTGRVKLAFVTGFGFVAALFYVWLQYNGITDQYLAMTGGSASSGRALQHGLTDYFLITPGLAIPSMGIAGLLFYLFRSSRHDLALKLWGFWLCLLALSFAAVSLVKQEHIAPFAQSRVLFWIAAFALLLPLVRERRFQPIPFFLLAISWCASISWGYNLPVLYSIPLVWGVMEVTDQFSGNTGLKKHFFGYSIALAAILLTVFRIDTSLFTAMACAQT